MKLEERHSIFYKISLQWKTLHIPKARRQMHGHVPVTLLKSVIFRQIVQVVATDDDGSLHLHLLDDTGQDATTNRHVAGEWALLVDIGAFDRL